MNLVPPFARADPVQPTRFLLWMGQGAAIASLLLGVTAFMVWLTDVSASVSAPFTTVFPTTALCLAMASFGLMVVWQGELTGRNAVLVRTLGVLVVLVAGSALLRTVAGGWPTIETLLGHLPGSRRVGSIAPPNAALGLLFIGLMLVLYDTQWRGRHPARFFVLPAVAIAFLGLIGSLYGAEALTRFRHFAAMPWGTAVGILLVGVSAFLSRPSRRYSSLFVLPGPVGDVVRVLVPIVFLLPIVLGLLVLNGSERQLYDERMGLALFTLATIITLVVIVLTTADRLRRTEERRMLAEAETQRLNVHLSRQAADLAAANKELEAFSYSVSHDLRAPLRSIDGFSQALLEDYGEALDDEAHDYLRRVRVASQRMGELIDGLLNLSRLSRASLQYEPVDLGRLAREKADALRRRDPDRDVAFHIAEGIEVQGDPRLLRALIDNLLENSWKFTRSHRRAVIEFGVARREAERAYFVKDDGAGFDMAYAEKLFTAFQRLHRTDEFEGMGIGLATCLRIVRRHGGRMWAEGAVERGATFYFTLGG